MGWLKHHDGAADQLHKVAGRVEVERAHCEQSASSAAPQDTHNPSVERKEERNSYPTQPKCVPDTELPFIAASEVKKEDGNDGRQLFIVVDDIVLDCTTYIAQHPGGRQIIQGFGGQNCGWQWWTFHDRRIWNDVAVKLRVGRTEGMENRFVKPPVYVGLRGFGYQDD